MNKIILLSVNARYIHAPLAAFALKAGIREFSTVPREVKIIEGTVSGGTARIIEKLVEENPDVIGISAYIWNAAMLPGLIAAIRVRLPCVKIVLGGPEASFNADFWIKTGADFVVCGEGERSFPALLDALDKGEAPARTVLSEDKGFIPPDPCDSEYLAAVKGRLAYIETSRGCPFSCEFCLSGGDSLRFFPLERAKSQIDMLAGAGAKTVKFVDRTFNCDSRRAYELFEHIIRLKTDTCFHFEAAADLFDDRTLKLLASAPKGRIQLEIGLQSFNADSLRESSRKTDIEKAERNIKTLIAAKNIHVHIDLIAGLPHETLESFQNGFDRAYELSAHTLQLGFLKLLHGSGLREKADKLGLIYSQNPPYEIISTRHMSAAELDILKQTENALQKTHNSGRLLSSMDYVLEATGLSAFAFYSWLGDAVSNHGMRFEDYAYLVYEYCCTLSGVDAAVLRDHMVCDLLASIKGRDMPENLRIPDKRLKKAASIASERLGHALRRHEVAMLMTRDAAVFVDSSYRDPVTGLYKTDFIDIE